MNDAVNNLSVLSIYSIEGLLQSSEKKKKEKKRKEEQVVPALSLRKKNKRKKKKTLSAKLSISFCHSLSL